MSDEPKFKTYLFQYRHDDAEWLLGIKAASIEDAKRRLAKMPWAIPLGELVVKVPSSFGWLAKMLCLVRGLFTRSR